MKFEDVFFIGGLVFIGYWLTKKNATIIASDTLDIKDLTNPDKATKVRVNEPYREEPKTIVLNMNTPMRANDFLDEKFVKDYNSSMEATFSPRKVFVKSEF